MHSFAPQAPSPPPFLPLQHKQSQFPSMHSSCCEGQGTRLFGSLAEYIYTLATAPSATSASASASAAPTPLPPAAERLATPPGSVATALYVDLYAASTVSVRVAGGGVATLQQDTAWPYGEAVTLTLTMPPGGARTPLDLALRMPSWLAPGSGVAVTVGGAAWPQQGVPGTYLHVSPPGGWAAGPTAVTFSLPMPLTAHEYTGASVLPPFSRWAFLVGPVLLAAQGPWNATNDALVMPPGLDPADPAAWLAPVPGAPLHFLASAGGVNVSFKPRFEIQDASEPYFSSWPAFWQA